MQLARFRRVLRQRMRALRRRHDVDRELSRELRFHLDQLTAEHVAMGLPPDQARHAARRALGNVPLIEAACRDTRRVGWLYDASFDLRYACRQLIRDRRALSAVVLTLALGVGVNAAIFSIVGGFRRPLPVPGADRIVVLAAETRGDERGARYRHSHAALEDFRRAGDHFTDLFGFSLQMTGVTVGDRATPFLYSAVTGNYFSALGVRPALGRLFVPGEGERPGEDSLLVLGYGFWQRRFGGDPRVIGSQVRVGGTLARIIGVTPREFHGTFSVAEMDGYLPLNAIRTGEEGRQQIFDDRTARWLTVLGRLKPGASIAEAEASMRLAAQRLEREHPRTDQGVSVRVVPETRARPDPVGLLGDAGRSDRAAELLLLALAALVLLLACLNVANLLLVRATVRTKEMALRAALGAGRARLIRQVLTETALVSLLGAGLGIVLGTIGSRLFEGSIDLKTDFPITLDFGIDWRVFLYAMAAAAVSAGVIAIWPAMRASRANAMEALQDGPRGASGTPRHNRLRRLLCAGQIAGSLVLLVVAALFVRDLRAAERLEIGFSPDNLLNVRMDPQWAGYDAERTREFYEELHRQVRALSGVESASLAYSVPMGYYWEGAAVEAEGRSTPPGEQPLVIPFNSVDPDYFQTIGMRITRGRPFSWSDAERGRPVAIVNETMAARFWPGQDAVGRQFRMRAPDWIVVQVIGVAGNSRYINLFEAPQPYFYVPLSQYEKSTRVLHVRSTLPTEQLESHVERTIATVGPDVPMMDMQSMRSALSGFSGLMLLRLGAIQASVLGILGLLLAVVGVYGVASYAAVQRTREIGIRMALGAQRADVMRLVLRQSATMVVGGAMAGLCGAALTAGALTRAVGMEAAIDPVVFVAATAALSAAALAACYLPARRAIAVAPTAALREE